MSDVVIKRERTGYRGQVSGVEILLRSRNIELPGRKHLVSGFWSLIIANMVAIGLVYSYVYFSDVDKFVGSMVLVAMLVPLCVLGGGAMFGVYGFRPGNFTPLRNANPARGRTIKRPNQRLTLGAKSFREVYEDDATNRQSTPIRVLKGSILRVRDDDGKDDLRYDTCAYSLIHGDDEQVILENVTRDEREVVRVALREAVQMLTQS